MELGKSEYISNETYHAQKDFTSSSGLVRLIQGTPKHYKSYLENKEEPTEAMRFGTAVHAAVLETELFKSKYVQKPENMSFATKDGKIWRDEQVGKEIVSFDDYNTIRSIYSAVMSDSEANDYLTDSGREESFFWRDDDSGILCRCRTDILKDNTIVDLKTTEDASDDGFFKAVLRYGYSYQAAFYLRGLKAVTGIDHTFKFLMVEKSAPYALNVHELGPQTLAHANSKITYALQMLKECQETGTYPGYYRSNEPKEVMFGL